MSDMDNNDNDNPENEFDPLAPSSSEEEEQAANDAQDQAQQNAEDSENLDEFETLEAELAKTKDQLLRALAENENTRRLARKDREDAGKYAISSFAREMLGVADNLRRALDHVPEDLIAQNAEIKNLTDGINATEREMLRTFEKQGIKQIDPMGELFNPNFHEVMFETPGTGEPAETVIQVMEKGYTLKDRLLRPARVGIAKADETGTSTTAPEEHTNEIPGGQIDTEA